ncbi:MAG: cupredoxin domain-containing protein [Cuniculiplasma sp.]
MKTIETWFFIGLLAIVLIFGAGMYFVGSSGHVSTSTQHSSNEYNITLVITNQNYMASAGKNQPAYYVLENGKMMSSAQIYLPSNSLVTMTIINYDFGPGSVSSAYSKVTGTLNNTEYVVNDTNINKSSSASGQWVSTVPSADLAHTFTIPQMNLNVLIPSDSIVVASFHTPKSGVFSWQCEVDCGTGSSGWGGAMTTPGWMQGEVVID